MKGDLDKDGKMSSYEKARSNAIQKAMAKKLGKLSVLVVVVKVALSAKALGWQKIICQIKKLTIEMLIRDRVRRRLFSKSICLSGKCYARE